jgi:AraC family transcriptional regulator, arabinose operon regulatory protein
MGKTPSERNGPSGAQRRLYTIRSPSLARILAEHGLRYDRLEDLPPKAIREIQRQAVFKDFRSIELPAPIICDSLERPILQDLLVTRIGSHTRGAGHYIPRPEGSLDHIWIYAVEGQGWCEIAGQLWTIPEDTVLLIPAHVPHYYGAVEEDPWSIYWIHFTGRLAEHFCRLLDVTEKNPLFQLERSPAVLSAFEAIYRPMSLAHVYSHLVSGAGALAHLLSMNNVERFSTNTRTQTAEANLDKTIEFMRDNLGKRVSLGQLARLAHMSPSHYSITFKKRNDHSPIEYFNRLKIQRACQLLVTTNEPVQTIARDFGFDDPYYFSRLFRQLVGVSPSHYRRGIGGSEDRSHR